MSFEELNKLMFDLRDAQRRGVAGNAKATVVVAQ